MHLTLPYGRLPGSIHRGIWPTPKLAFLSGKCPMFALITPKTRYEGLTPAPKYRKFFKLKMKMNDVLNLVKEHDIAFVLQWIHGNGPLSVETHHTTTILPSPGALPPDQNQPAMKGI